MRQGRRVAIVASIGGLIGLAACAHELSSVQTREVAFVANAEDGTVSLVDVAARAVIGVLDVNPAKTRVDRAGTPNYAQDTDVSPDGSRLYVSRAYLGDVAAFDVATGALIWRRPLETVRADHMTITPDGRHLFVSALADQLAYRIDTATGALTGHLVTGVYPHDNQVSKDGRLIYNASIGPLGGLPLARRPGLSGAPADRSGYDFQLTIAHVQTLQVTDRIKFDNGIRPWRLTPDEKGIYAQQSNEHAVIAYDFAAQRIVRRLQLPIADGVTPADWDFEAPHHGLAMTDDGATLCLAGRASDYAALVRAPELALIATVKVGDAPGWSEIAGDGRLCLIANTRSDNLSIISITERAEVMRLAMGNGPKHITVARIPLSVIEAFSARLRRTR